MSQRLPGPRCGEERATPRGLQVVVASPIQIGDWELAPLVGVSSCILRRAFVGTDGEAACARGVARFKPMGLMTRRYGAEKLVRISDWTARISRLFVVAGLIIPVGLVLSAALDASRRRRAKEIP